MNCSQCGNKIEQGHIAAAHEYFCSQICHLRFWKEQMPSLGGEFITDDFLNSFALLGDKSKEMEYEKIIDYISDNFGSTKFFRLLNDKADELTDALNNADFEGKSEDLKEQLDDISDKLDELKDNVEDSKNRIDTYENPVDKVKVTDTIDEFNTHMDNMQRALDRASSTR